MDWCGRIGEVRELYRSEWSVGYHWVIPKIFSMPDRMGPVYYSPTFKFLNMTWCLGIYLHSSIGNEEWIGLDIRRSTRRIPVPALFSVGVMLADQSEYLLHRNINFPSRDSVCSINDFLLQSTLTKVKEKYAPSDELTILCVIWPDVPASGECLDLWQFEQNMNSGDQTHRRKKVERKDAVTKDVSMSTDGISIVEILRKSTEESNKLIGSDGQLREISTRDELFTRSMPSQTTQDASSPDSSCGRRKDYVRTCSESALSSKVFSQSAQNKNFRWDPRARIKDMLYYLTMKNHAPGTEDATEAEDESECMQTQTKTVAVSDKPSVIDGTVREISRGVKWDIRLPPSKTTWDVLSPEFTCGGIKYHFRMYSSELHSNDIYLGFIVNVTNDANFPLPIRWRMAVKRRDLVGLRWVMNGHMIAKGKCQQYAHEVCIKRAELECSLSFDFQLTFVHYLNVGDVDGEQEASTQTDKTSISRETQTEDQIGGTVDLEDFEEQLQLCLTDPEKGDYVQLIQKKPLDTSIEEYLSELPRDDKKDRIFAA